MCSKSAASAWTGSQNWAADSVQAVRAIAAAAGAAALLWSATACSDGSDADGNVEERSESWCDVVAASNVLDDEFDEVAVDDAGGMKSVLEKISGLGDRFRAAAPDGISDQVTTYADANDALVQVFVDADYDVVQLDNTAIDTLISSVDGVDTEIDVYTVAECGVALGPDDT